MHTIRDEIGSEHSTREVFGDLDLDIAKVALPCSTLALLFIWVIGLRRPWWSTFQTTVPIVRDERFTFVPLSGAMRINIVDMWEIGLKSAGQLVHSIYILRRRNCLLFFAEGNHIIHVEQFLAPFLKVGRIRDYSGGEMAVAFLIRGSWAAINTIFLL